MNNVLGGQAIVANANAGGAIYTLTTTSSIPQSMSYNASAVLSK